MVMASNYSPEGRDYILAPGWDRGRPRPPKLPLTQRPFSRFDHCRAHSSHWALIAGEDARDPSGKHESLSARGCYGVHQGLARVQ